MKHGARSLVEVDNQLAPNYVHFLDGEDYDPFPMNSLALGQRSLIVVVAGKVALSPAVTGVADEVDRGAPDGSSLLPLERHGEDPTILDLSSLKAGHSMKALMALCYFPVPTPHTMVESQGFTAGRLFPGEHTVSKQVEGQPQVAVEPKLLCNTEGDGMLRSSLRSEVGEGHCGVRRIAPVVKGKPIR